MEIPFVVHNTPFTYLEIYSITLSLSLFALLLQNSEIKQNNCCNMAEQRVCVFMPVLMRMQLRKRERWGIEGTKRDKNRKWNTFRKSHMGYNRIELTHRKIHFSCFTVYGVEFYESIRVCVCFFFLRRFILFAWTFIVSCVLILVFI